MNVRLSLAMSRNPRVAALLDGACRPTGIELAISELQAPDIFWRQLRFAEFDVSEMSLSSLLMLIDRGRMEWVAIPVFHDRRFFHSYVLVRRGAGIEVPADLKGRHVGVPDYQQTAALWTRAALEEDFGVRPQDMIWHMERHPSLSHGGGVGFEPPEGIELHYIPEDSSIGSMLVDGQLDAAIVYEPALLFNDEPTTVDRSPVRLPEDAATWLFSDKVAECRRMYETHGYVPANHCVVIRRSIIEAHPWIALNVFHAFEESKRLNDRYLSTALQLHGSLGYLDFNLHGTPAALDLFPYGLAGNRDVLEALARHSTHQGLTSREIPMREVFARSTLDL